MTTPFQRELLETLNRSPCDAGEETRRALGTIGDLFWQIYDAPLTFHSPSLSTTDIVAFEESQQMIAGPVKWAVCVGGIHIAPAAGNLWIGVVKGKVVKNKKGEHPEVREKIFFLRGKSGQNYSLSNGEVFAWQFDSNGDRIVLFDPLDATGAAATGDDATYQHGGSDVGQQPKLNFVDSASVTWTATHDSGNNRVNISATAISSSDNPVVWCKAQKQWSTDGLVEVKVLDGYDGAETGSAVNAYFTNIGDFSTKCPNVRRRQQIACAYDADDRLVVIDPHAYQAPLGDVIWRAKDTPSEWDLIGGAQTVTLTGATSGNFTLTFDGQVTANIAYDASTATVEAALEALSNVGSGNVTVTGVTGAWIVDFAEAIETDHEAMTFTNVSLNVGASGSVSGIYISGWGKQDGIHNAASPYNGSGIDWTTDAGVVQDEAPPYYLAPSLDTPTNAADGGAYDDIAHNHAITVNANTTGYSFSIADHGDHVHVFGCSTCQDVSGSGSVTYWGVINWSHQHSPSGLLYTLGSVDNGVDHSGTHSGTTHRSHSVTPSDPGHPHTAESAETYQYVHWKSLIPVERVDNSTEALGI